MVVVHRERCLLFNIYLAHSNVAEAQESVASAFMAEWMNKNGTRERGHAFSPVHLVSRVLEIESGNFRLRTSCVPQEGRAGAGSKG